MSVKEAVLSRLELHRGEDISGEALAKELGVSRAAVWKAINSLKEQGYPIESSTNRGYRLSNSADILSAEGIKLHLVGAAALADVSVYDEIDSTNLEAKRRAANGVQNTTVIVADSQTIGRGRFSRSFYSPEGCGIYMSILLKPTQEQISEAVMMTTAAAVAVCRATSALSDVSTGIKWVNDIYVDGKKVCGILSEAIFDIESASIGSIVIGIGINFKNGTEPFPAEIAGIAGTFFGENPPVSRNRFAAQVVNELLTILPDLSKREFLKEYRERSILIGEEIVYSRGNEKFAATAEDIDGDGALVVRYEDGRVEALNSGEVSVRPKAKEASLPFPTSNA